MVRLAVGLALVLGGCVDGLPDQDCFGDVDCPSGRCVAGACVTPDGGVDDDARTEPGDQGVDARVPPDGAMVDPDGAVVDPDGAMVDPDGAMVDADGAVADPDGAVVDPDGAVVDPDGAVVEPDGAVVDPDAAPPPRPWTTTARRGEVLGTDTPVSAGNLVARDGWAYLADHSNRQVVAFDMEGDRRIHIAGSGHKWSDPQREGRDAQTQGLYTTTGLTMTDAGDLLVGTSQFSRILRVDGTSGAATMLAHSGPDVYRQQGGLVEPPATLELEPRSLAWATLQDGTTRLYVASGTDLSYLPCTDPGCTALGETVRFGLDLERPLEGEVRIAATPEWLVVGDSNAVLVASHEARVVVGPVDRLDFGGAPGVVPWANAASFAIESVNEAAVVVVAVRGHQVVRVTLPFELGDDRPAAAEVVINQSGCDRQRAGCACNAEVPADPLDLCLAEPNGVAVDAGSVVVSDRGAVWRARGEQIRRIGGDGTWRDAGDGGPATSARLFGPMGLAASERGVYIADRSHSAVRLVTPGGEISSIDVDRPPWGVAAIDNTLHVSVCDCTTDVCGPFVDRQTSLYTIADDGSVTPTARNCFSQPPTPLLPGGLLELDGELMVADGPRLVLPTQPGGWRVFNQQENGWPACDGVFPELVQTRMALDLARGGGTIYVAGRDLSQVGRGCIGNSWGVARYDLEGRRLMQDWGRGRGTIEDVREGIDVDRLQTTLLTGVAADGPVVYLAGDFLIARGQSGRGIVRIAAGQATPYVGFGTDAEFGARPEAVGEGGPLVPRAMPSTANLLHHEGHLYWSSQDYVYRLRDGGDAVELVAGRRDPPGVRDWADGGWLTTPAGLTALPDGGYLVAGGDGGRIYQTDDDGIRVAAFQQYGLPLDAAETHALNVDTLRHAADVAWVDGGEAYTVDRDAPAVIELLSAPGGRFEARRFARMPQRPVAVTPAGGCDGRVLVGAGDEVFRVVEDNARMLVDVGEPVADVAVDGDLLAVVSVGNELRTFVCAGIGIEADSEREVHLPREAGPGPARIAALGGGEFAVASATRIYLWNAEDGFRLVHTLVKRGYIAGLTATANGLAYTNGWAGTLVELTPRD